MRNYAFIPDFNSQSTIQDLPKVALSRYDGESVNGMGMRRKETDDGVASLVPRGDLIGERIRESFLKRYECWLK